MMSSHDRRHARGLLTLARFLAKLKHVKRTGWLDRGIPEADVESVADHSLGVALLAWACAVERHELGAPLDPARVALLAMVHDLPEAETGDPPPYDPSAIPPPADQTERRAFLERRHIRDDERQQAKRDAEAAAMRRLLAALPENVHFELQSLWDELRRGESAEARFVKQIDRLETFLQSRVYHEQFPDAPMASFAQEVLETIDDPLLTAIRDESIELQGPQ